MDCIEHFTSLSTELCMSLCSLTMCIWGVWGMLLLRSTKEKPANKK
jgi:hypothetical protein